LRFVHPDTNAVTGDARLRNLEQCAADAITVTYAHGIVGQPFDGEILTKLSVDEVGAFQLLLPVTVGFDLVDENSSLLASMAGKITLTVCV
jgi:hypothetical protein